MKRALVGLASVAALLAVAPRAAAQESAASRAQALFDEGRRLMSEGKLTEACPKLAASEQLDPGAGTLMNLGTCYERNAQLASAWGTFKEAAAASRSAGHADWESAARARAEKLEPELPHLVITITKPNATGLVVETDGAATVPAEWGSPIPIDPGAHKISAHAPGKKPWTADVKVDGPGVQVSVTVPLLADDPNAAPASAAPPGRGTEPPAEPRDAGKMQRTFGIVAGGAGVVGVALGTIFGLKARSTYHDGSGQCNTQNQCSQTALDTINDAHSQATVSTVGFIAGGALLAGGVTLFLTAPKAENVHVSLGGPGRAGMSVGGTF